MAIVPEEWRKDLIACKFPATRTIRCWHCVQWFDVVFDNLESTRHACTHCGTVHYFDLPGLKDGRVWL